MEKDMNVRGSSVAYITIKPKTERAKRFLLILRSIKKMFGRDLLELEVSFKRKLEICLYHLIYPFRKWKIKYKCPKCKNPMEFQGISEEFFPQGKWYCSECGESYKKLGIGKPKKR